MASSEKLTLNATKGWSVKVPCSKCSGKTHHNVCLSLDRSGDEGQGEWQISWNEHLQIIQCQGCHVFSFRKTFETSEDYFQIGDDEWETDIQETLYPPRIEGRREIDDTYMPIRVRKIYAETLRALNSGSPILTGIGLRTLVEAVCTEEEASGSNLFENIDDLVKNGKLTPAGAEILHNIRNMGNDAAHEVNPHNEIQLGLAMDVVEHLLQDVYILPARVKAEFGKKKS